MIKLIVRALGVVVPLTLLIAPVTQASSQASLAGVRQATAKFHDPAVARLAQYNPLLACFDLPGVGGMGQHYVNTGLLNGTVNAAEPEALVYEVDGDRLQLVAVEYIIPLSAWQSADKPTLFGREFTRIDSLGLWALHAWIWRPNPDGIFANYNPSVRMCPGH
ncbi:MAG TPA: hypothetical protein VEN12_02025 [Verrucomicrobiae bacterium]|nr:hypothetical protein [Verrucomicrobiae bacterium]